MSQYTVTIATQPDVIVTGTAVGVPGATGPQGPAGADGADGGAEVFTQATPSSTWIIDHGLTYRPNVQVVDGSGATVIATVSHPTDTRVQINFASAQTGAAYLS